MPVVDTGGRYKAGRQIGQHRREMKAKDSGMAMFGA